MQTPAVETIPVHKEEWTKIRVINLIVDAVCILFVGLASLTYFCRSSTSWQRAFRTMRMYPRTKSSCGP